MGKNKVGWKQGSEVGTTGVMGRGGGKGRKLYLNNNKIKKYLIKNKIKSFCMAKENSIKIKRELTMWENIFTHDTSDKGLISKIYKELTRLHSRKTKHPIKKWTKDLNRHFSREDIQRGQRHLKRYSASLASQRYKLKPQ